MQPGGLKTSATTLVEMYHDLAIERRGEVDLRAFLAEHRIDSDLLLAEIIESDGRIREQFAQPITLARYFDAIDDLRDRPDALDAAIDLALRGASSRSNADNEAIARLVNEYPDLAAEIHDAAMLNNALLSTTGLRRRVTTTAAYRLPFDFGPRLEDGQQRYRLEELLGAGAFGEVYLATDRHLSDADHDARVALKVLSPRHDDPFDRRQLAEEAMKARRINHPFVVRVFDRGTTEQDEDFIVYELVERGSLQHWLRKRRLPLPPREAAALMAKIARGLQAAHAAGLIHCDLKPGNIMMTVEGDPKISDFGIAIRAGEQLHRRAGTGSGLDSAPIGNQAFISPEQYRREDGSLTVASDLYALGGILFYLLTGELPNGKTPDEIARTHNLTRGRTEPPSVRAVDRTIDEDLDRIARRAMAADPADRHNSAGALADDLDAWLAHEPIQWMKPSLPRVIGLWARRRPAVAAMAAILGIATIGGALGAQHLVSRRAQADQNYGEMADQYEKYRASILDRGTTLYSIAREEPYLSSYLGYLLSWNHMMGPGLMSEPALLVVDWKARDGVMRQYIAHMEELGLGDHWSVQLHRGLLALWLTDRGTHEGGDLAVLEEAHNLIRTAIDRYRAAQPDDDYMLNTLLAIQRIVDIERLLVARAANEAISDDQRAELLALADELIARIDEVRRIDPTHPVRGEAAETLIRLFGPEALNDEARLEVANEMADVPSAASHFPSQ